MERVSAKNQLFAIIHFMKKVIEKFTEGKNMKRVVFFLKENKKTVLTLMGATIFADILFLKKSSDFVTFSILIIYVVFIKMFQIKSKSTFLLSLALLGGMFISYLLTGASIPTEKAAVWLILFLAVGIIQQWKE